MHHRFVGESPRGQAASRLRSDRVPRSADSKTDFGPPEYISPQVQLRLFRRSSHSLLDWSNMVLCCNYISQAIQRRTARNLLRWRFECRGDGISELADTSPEPHAATESRQRPGSAAILRSMLPNSRRVKWLSASSNEVRRCLPWGRSIPEAPCWASRSCPSVSPVVCKAG